MRHLAAGVLWVGFLAADLLAVDMRSPGAGPDGIRLEAYVDRAPEEASVLREVHVHDKKDRSRTLFVVSALRPGGPESAQYFDIFPKKGAVTMELFGNDERVASIIDAPAGAKLIASVVPYGDDRRLMVGHVTIEEAQNPDTRASP